MGRTFQTAESYLYYLDVKSQTFGIPKPKGFESRPEVQKIKSKWRKYSLAV